MATKKGPKTPMTDEHKEALARGRAEGKAVRDYLEALRANKPRRGRKRTPESISRRISAIDSEIINADPLTELKLVEERRRLLEDLTTIGNKIDIDQLEKAFVSVAKSYGERQGISYASWREVGVEARVLRSAGLGRGD
jgi:uncharacterized protein YicC (UPF0701 family)